MSEERQLLAVPGSTVRHPKRTDRCLPITDLHSDAGIHNCTLLQHSAIRRTRRPIAEGRPGEIYLGVGASVPHTDPESPALGLSRQGHDTPRGPPHSADGHCIDTSDSSKYS